MAVVLGGDEGLRAGKGATGGDEMEGRESLLRVTAAWRRGGNSIGIKHLRQGSLGLTQWAVGTTEVFASGAWLNGAVLEEG